MSHSKIVRASAGSINICNNVMDVIEVQRKEQRRQGTPLLDTKSGFDTGLFVSINQNVLIIMIQVLQDIEEMLRELTLL